MHPTLPKTKKLAVLILGLLAFASSCTSATPLARNSITVLKERVVYQTV